MTGDMGQMSMEERGKAEPLREAENAAGQLGTKRVPALSDLGLLGLSSHRDPSRHF